MSYRQTRAEFLALCRNQDSTWLWACALDPSPYMGKRHVRWIRLALKLRGFSFA